MARFDWHRCLELGDPIVDRQHRDFLSLLNVALDLNGSREGHQDRVRAIVDELIAYTDAHFAEEERLMAASGYPGIAAHVHGHRTLRRRAMELHGRLHQEGAPGAAELFFLLRQWFEDHVAGHDQELQRWTTQRGHSATCNSVDC